MNIMNNLQGFGLLAVFFGLASAIFWMVVAWRAMRAHERLADASENALRNYRERELQAKG